MKKSTLIILTILALITLIIVGLNLTGKVVWGPDFQGIFRAVPFKNIETNTTDIYIRIASIENVMAIQEFFSSEDCEVLDYSLDKDIDIFEFNKNENTWIFANRSDILDVELFYQIPYDCDVNSGKYYTADSFPENNECYGGDTNSDGVVDAIDFITMKRNFGKVCVSPDWCDGADVNKDGKVNSTDLNTLTSGATTSECANIIGNDINEFIESLTIEDSSISTSGSSDPTSSSNANSAGTSSPNQIEANEIVQTETSEEYTTQSLSVTERLAGITDESHELKKINFYPFLILISTAIIILIAIITFIFFKKPKEFRKRPMQIKKKNI